MHSTHSPSRSTWLAQPSMKPMTRANERSNVSPLHRADVGAGMRFSLTARRRLAVAAGFAAFLLIGLAAAYVLNLLPTFETKCAAQCEAQGFWKAT